MAIGLTEAWNNSILVIGIQVPQMVWLEEKWLLKGVYVLIPGTFGYISLHNKEEIQETESRLLISYLWDGQIILNDLDEPNVITSILISGRVRQRLIDLKMLHCGLGGWKKEPRNAAICNNWKRQENWFSPRASRRKLSPVDTLILAL